MATFHPDPGTHRNRRQGIGVLVFIVLALVMTYLPPDRQQEVAAVLRSTVLRPFIATQELVARARVQTQDVTVLRGRMDSLVSVVTNQTTLAEENRRLRELLDLKRRIGVDYRPASLLRPGTEGSESMFLVDLEGVDSVRAGAPVIAPEGLVGVVRENGPGGAMGMDWTHPDFRASAMTFDGTTYGIVEPAPGELPRDDRLILTGTPFTTRLEPGTWIVTSGRGGIYPRGIPIGRIEGLTESEGGWRKTYSVEPAVQLGAVTHVLVGVAEMPLPAAASTEAFSGAPPGEGTEGPTVDSRPDEGGGADLRPIMLPQDSAPSPTDADAVDEGRSPEPAPSRAEPTPDRTDPPAARTESLPTQDQPSASGGGTPSDPPPSDADAPRAPEADPDPADAAVDIPPDSALTPDDGLPSEPAPDTGRADADALPPVDSSAVETDSLPESGTEAAEPPGPPVPDSVESNETSTPDSTPGAPASVDSGGTPPGVR